MLRKESSCLLNALRNFNKTFRKDMTYDNILSHKKARVYPPSSGIEHKTPNKINDSCIN